MPGAVETDQGDQQRSRDHLGAVSRATAPRTGPCDVPFAAPSEPLGVIRSPAATVRIGEVNLIIYPRQHPGPLVSTRGHAVDHIAVGVPDLNAALESLRKSGVTVLEEPASIPGEAALLSEAALATDWSRPEEDVAWSHLQPEK